MRSYVKSKGSPIFMQGRPMVVEVKLRLVNSASSSLLRNDDCMTDDDVFRIERNQRTSIPRYPKAYQALFYGISCTQPHVVAVHVDLGVLKENHSVDDLDIDEWLDERQPSVVDQSLFVVEVDVLDLVDRSNNVDPSITLFHPRYAILRCPLEEFEPQEDNAFVMAYLGLALTGNVMVVALDESSRVDDVQGHEEIRAVNEVLKRYGLHKTNSSGPDLKLGILVSKYEANQRYRLEKQKQINTMPAVFSVQHSQRLFPFFRYPNVVFVMFEFCTISALVSLSRTCKGQQGQVRRFLLSRVRRFLSAFLDHDQQRQLFNCMRIHGGGISGSVATAILTLDAVFCSRDLPNDLNITIPAFAQSAWGAMMRSFSDGAMDAQAVNVRLGYVQGLRKVTAYRVRNPRGCFRNVVVAESRTGSILAPTLMSEWTSQMILITFSKIVVVYPKLLNNSHAVLGFPGSSTNAWTRYYHRGIWRFSATHHLPEGYAKWRSWSGEVGMVKRKPIRRCVTKG
ncbi:hypothetical protein DFH09DRAFT_1069894 [Mycena vulgaris]|nr:hypothetical protein DFH09DRAFT_1069894 [Mycena vulgaris]